MGRGWKVLIPAVCLILIGLGCFLSYHAAHFWYRGNLRVDNPPETFREEELIGIWKANYKYHEWERCDGYSVMKEARSLVEWLVLREDKTFFQVLQDRRGEIPEQRAQGQWWVERFPDGATLLHLEKGRFFAEEVCRLFPYLAPLTSMRSYGTDQVEQNFIFDLQKEVVMIVGWDKFTKELYLEYPFVGGDPDSPVIVEFERVPESEADSVPTLEP